jgi:formamidopyrimidine-DNA glycosylase
MFELPEYINFARQMNATLAGKTLRSGELGNSPHKFVWYNCSHEDFAARTTGKTVGTASSRGRWLFLPLEPGQVLVFGECGGKLLYHQPGTELPKKYHLLLHFTDGSALSTFTQMWGAMELYETGRELQRQYIRGMHVTPVDPTFTFDYFNALIDELLMGEKRSAKSLLTQDQLIPGLGNAIAQDILFRARIAPRRSLSELTTGMRRDLHAAILDTVNEVIDGGGRNDEFDLFGQPGRYQRLMDSKSAGKPCPECGTPIQKMQYLGGACYFCPKCQE